MRSKLLNSTVYYAPPGEQGSDDNASDAGPEKPDTQTDGKPASGNGGQEPAAGAGNTQESEPGDADAGGGGEAEPARGTKPDWRDKQIGRQHRKLKDHEKTIAELKAENERLKSGGSAGGGDSTGRGDAARTQPDAGGGSDGSGPQRYQFRTKEEFDAAVKQEAENQRLSSDLQTLYTSGEKEYGRDRWTNALSTLDAMDVPQGELLNIMGTDDPAKVVYELGANPEEAERIFALPPAKRLNEYVKMAMAVKPKPKPSNAPAPVDTITQRGSSSEPSLYDKELPEAEWRRVRDQQKAQSAGRRWSRPRGAA